MSGANAVIAAFEAEFHGAPVSLDEFNAFVQEQLANPSNFEIEGSAVTVLYSGLR